MSDRDLDGGDNEVLFGDRDRNGTNAATAPSSARTAAGQAPSRYYYNAGDATGARGPVSLDDLRIMAARGEITPYTPVIREGAPEWGQYRDLQSGERTKEVAEAVVERATRMAEALKTEQSRSFGLGLLIGVVRLLSLPWDLVSGAARTVSEWGSTRFVAMPRDSLTASTAGRIAAPLWLLLWTAWWCGDCLAMIVVGRPSFSLSVFSTIAGLFTMGFSLPNSADLSSRMMYASAKASFTEAMTVQDFGNRLAWVVKLALFGYLITPLWALVGEFFTALAALIGLRRGTARGATSPR
jgi:hypothetical protein